MRFNQHNMMVSNRVLDYIRKNTETISDGEAVVMLVLWRFINDHAQTMHGMNAETLLREQIEAFIKFQRENLKLTEVHLPAGHG